MTEPAASATTDDSDAPFVMRLDSPEELLAAIPVMWGFHPHDSVVAIGLRRDDPEIPHPRSCFGLRSDLPDGGPDADRELAAYLADALVEHGSELTVLVAYSDDDTRARSLLTAVADAAADRGVVVHDALRADGRRWWSYVCANPDCCPPTGRPYDPETSRITADAVFAGRPIFRSREEAAELVRPLLGPTREEMQRATERAEDALTTLWTEAIDLTRDADDIEEAADHVVEHGSAAVLAVVQRFVSLDPAAHDGDADPVPSDDDVALLSVFCANLLIRDAAWCAMTRHTADRHLALWRHVTQRAVPPYDVAPAALLAFAAWLADDAVLARFALERALTADPNYSLARLIAEALYTGMPPSRWDALALRHREDRRDDQDDDEHEDRQDHRDRRDSDRD